ncbi:MAG: hypothetical protein M0P01_15535 [Treponema sp.]|nr:hypothetical protein [Treponema sp.]
MEKFKVIMTGETADLPEPFMLADRSFGCRLTVHAYSLSYVGTNRCVRGGDYTVEVPDGSCWLHLRRSVPGSRVLVCGLLSGSVVRGCRIITKQREDSL